ncbi:MAG: signal recognition particle-docking protein FtsY [Candidatus Poseidoniales archaeon]|nr:MAG: signal recognition particle-docking protein FtsY [Candidatus Poseidoniales archaeon]
MGLFDRFKKRVKDVVDETDQTNLSVEADSEEGQATLLRESVKVDDEWEDLDALEAAPEVESKSSDDDWDDWDDDEPVINRALSRKERKLLERQEKDRKRAEDRAKKALKKRGATEMARPRGSKVDLSMMRTTTGRQLVEVAQTPRGTSKQANIETGGGSTVSVDLGGGVVEEGGRVIKEGSGLDNLLEELEWVLLESDISSEATSAIIDSLRGALVGARLRKGADLSKVLEAALKRSLQSLLEAGYWDFDASIRRFVAEGDTPVVVMLVGVNGTGKTTTAAKIAHRLLNNDLSVIAAAGDTFRAGAIQQLESHCERLGIRCVSSQRGGDSAAIARDAIESAKAKGIDVVLVDTAGRMQNKTNLMNELNKVRKVTNPHLTLFVGDSLAGNDAVEQAKMFQEIMKFDGAVLTKMDTDAKGGAGLSIAFATGRPIVFAGVGQGYDDLLQFDPEWLLKQLFE